MRNARGSMVLMIAVSMAVLSAMVDAVLSRYDANVRNFASFNDKTRAFYMSEGVRAIATVQIEDYLQKQPLAPGQQIADYLTGALATLDLSPYTVSNMQVNVLAMKPNSTIPNGAFAGMNGPITELEVKFNVNGPSSLFQGTGSVVEALSLHLSVAYISMFQFMMFYDVPLAEMATGPDMHAQGRVHSNGDFCVGGQSGTEYFQKVTVGGAFMTNRDSHCGSYTQGVANTQISVNGQFSSFLPITEKTDHYCTNCGGTGLSWDVYATKRWNGQVQDSAHGVQVLRLPGAGMGRTQTQSAGGYNTVANSTNLRFIVDPVLGGDSGLVRTYKYANQADIRIINGVWYIRNPKSTNDWPGIPIWSDHPGSYTELGMKVGQDDLRAYWGNWPAAPATPRAFSYYEYNEATQTIFDDSTATSAKGVISYGSLIATGQASQPLRPGYWVDSGNKQLCTGLTTLSCGSGCGFKDVWDGTGVTCASPSTKPGYATLILNATRSGFTNGHDYGGTGVAAGSSGTNGQAQGRSRVMPINFDIAQFQAALKNTSPGELGSYFGGGSFAGQPFNGIIYVDSQWPGSLNGFGGVGGAPSEAPVHGKLTDANQIDKTSVYNEQALPQPLCASATGSPSYVGLPYDNVGTPTAPINRFKVPDCASYSGSSGSWPSVIRVINGASLDPLVLTKGLSFVSRLPVWLTGDFNTSSDVSSGTSSPWVSALIAGDKVGLLSNNWNDKNDPWSAPTVTRTAAALTTYNTAMLSDPAVNLDLLLENWDSQKLVFNGSMVFGYQRVFANHDNYCCSTYTYEPPDRTFNFDQHFSLINNQPPGTPVFPVAATITWSK